jgi:short subunit dehydrogenase
MFTVRSSPTDLSERADRIPGSQMCTTAMRRWWSRSRVRAHHGRSRGPPGGPRIAELATRALWHRVGPFAGAVGVRCWDSCAVTFIAGANKGLVYETARRLVGRERTHSTRQRARHPPRRPRRRVDRGARRGGDRQVRAHRRPGQQRRFWRVGPLEATPLDKARKQFDVNVIGLLATTKALLPHFRTNRSGIVVNISSMGGRFALPLGTLYHGTKFAVEGLSEALHYELAPLGVRVKVVAPGGIHTDLGGRSFDFSNDVALQEYQPLVSAVLANLGPIMDAGGSEPADVATVIFDAVTDGTDTLRYVAGDDAQQLLAARSASDDSTFFSAIRSQMGLDAQSS